MPNAFDGRAGFNMDAVVFPLGVLAAVTLVVGGAGDGRARTGCRYEARLFCSPPSLSCLSLDSKLLEQKP